MPNVIFSGPVVRNPKVSNPKPSKKLRKNIYLRNFKKSFQLTPYGFNIKPFQKLLINTLQYHFKYIYKSSIGHLAVKSDSTSN